MKAKDGGQGQVHVYPFNDKSETGHAKWRTHQDTIANGMKSLEDPLGKPVSVVDELPYFVTHFTISICRRQMCFCLTHKIRTTPSPTR